MASRDHEIVEKYKEFFANRLNSLHLQPIEGRWYLFEQEGRIPKVLLMSDEGLFIDEPYTVERIEELGWTATPLIIYKVR